MMRGNAAFGAAIDRLGRRWFYDSLHDGSSDAKSVRPIFKMPISSVAALRAADAGVLVNAKNLPF
jgi:hypothetical protein